MLQRGSLTPPPLGSLNRLPHPTRLLSAVRDRPSKTRGSRRDHLDPPLSVRGRGQDHARTSGKPPKARTPPGAPGARSLPKDRRCGWPRPPRPRPLLPRGGSRSTMARTPVKRQTGMGADTRTTQQPRLGWSQRLTRTDRTTFPRGTSTVKRYPREESVGDCRVARPEAEIPS